MFCYLRQGAFLLKYCQNVPLTIQITLTQSLVLAYEILLELMTLHINDYRIAGLHNRSFLYFTFILELKV